MSPLLTLRGPAVLAVFPRPSAPGTGLQGTKPPSPSHLLTFPFCPRVEVRLACVASEARHSHLLDPPPYLTDDAPAVRGVFRVLSKAIFLSSPRPSRRSLLRPGSLFPTPRFLLLLQVSFDWASNRDSTLTPFQLVRSPFYEFQKHFLPPGIHVSHCIPNCNCAYLFLSLELPFYFLTFLSVRSKAIPVAEQFNVLLKIFVERRNKK